MRIDPQIPASESSGTSRVNDLQAGQSKSAPAPVSSGPNDTVQLSSGQATVRQLISKLAEIPDIRQHQVNALRSEIQSGQFNRSNEQVADAIVGQSLGTKTNG